MSSIVTLFPARREGRCACCGSKASHTWPGPGNDLMCCGCFSHLEGPCGCPVPPRTLMWHLAPFLALAGIAAVVGLVCVVLLNA